MAQVAGWKSRVAVVPRAGAQVAAFLDELPLAGNEAAGARAEALRDLHHPNLEAVWEVRREGPALVVVTEHVEGERLDVLVREGPPPIEVGLRIVVDVLAALAALHGRTPPVAHGDVTPDNVVVGVDGVTRLARAWLFGRTATVADDLRALGELLDRLVPPTARPKWAAPIEGIVAKAMAVEPSEGYASAGDMTRDLRMMGRTKIARPGRIAAFVEALAGDAIAERRRALPAPTTPRGQTVRMPAATAVAAPPKPKKKTPRPALLAPVPAAKTTGGFRVPKDRSPWFALVALLLLLGGGGAWWLHARAEQGAPAVAVEGQPPVASATTTEVAPPGLPAATGSSTAGTGARAPGPHAPPPPPPQATTSATGRRPYDRSAIF